ncbi:MAG: hypothetical protein V1495_00975 [Pseudomonadota bacterium]
MSGRNRWLVVFAFVAGSALVFSCSKAGPTGDKDKAEKLWGSERVCLPCHIYQKPIARNHNYRCDTCHRGNPWAEDLEEGHFEMVRAPQQPAYIALTCDKCHRRVLGRDVPYDAEFIKDVLVSHQMKAGETLEWKE